MVLSSDVLEPNVELFVVWNINLVASLSEHAVVIGILTFQPLGPVKDRQTGSDLEVVLVRNVDVGIHGVNVNISDHIRVLSHNRVRPKPKVCSFDIPVVKPVRSQHLEVIQIAILDAIGVIASKFDV